MKIFVFSSQPWGWHYHPSMSSAKAIVLPPDFSGFSFNTNILAALALKLPLKSTNNSSSLVQEWFSKEYPNAELKDIQTLTIPSDSTLQHLAIQLPIAMENGFISLVVPQDLSQLFLPLWVIEYWKQLSKFILHVSWFVTPDWVTDHMTGQVTCHQPFIRFVYVCLCLSMFVYICLVTWPFMETVYSSHAKGTYFP